MLRAVGFGGDHGCVSHALRRAGVGHRPQLHAGGGDVTQVAGLQGGEQGAGLRKIAGDAMAGKMPGRQRI